MKALRLGVYRGAGGADCTNGGVSGRFDELFVPCEAGPFDIDEDNPQLMRVAVREVGMFRALAHLEPYRGGEGIGPMFGGNYAGSSDARFAAICRQATGTPPGVLPVHDRYETPSQYAALSR